MSKHQNAIRKFESMHISPMRLVEKPHMATTNEWCVMVDLQAENADIKPESFNPLMIAKMLMHLVHAMLFCDL